LKTTDEEACDFDMRQHLALPDELMADKSIIHGPDVLNDEETFIHQTKKRYKNVMSLQYFNSTKTCSSSLWCTSNFFGVSICILI